MGLGLSVRDTRWQGQLSPRARLWSGLVLSTIPMKENVVKALAESLSRKPNLKSKRLFSHSSGNHPTVLQVRRRPGLRSVWSRSRTFWLRNMISTYALILSGKFYATTTIPVNKTKRCYRVESLTPIVINSSKISSGNAISLRRPAIRFSQGIQKKRAYRQL